MKVIKKERRTIVSRTGKPYRCWIATVQCPFCKDIYEKIWEKKTSKSKTCQHCNRVNRGWEKPRYGYKNCGQLSKGVFGRIKNTARARNIEFNLDHEFLWALYQKQEGKCALSGLELKLELNYMNSSTGKSTFIDPKPVTASLDRIDSTKGYVEGNVQWVHKAINLMKSSLIENDFIYYCKKVSDFNIIKDNTEPSSLYGGRTLIGRKGAETNR